MYVCITDEVRARKEQMAMLKRISALFPLSVWLLYRSTGIIYRNYFTEENSMQLALAA